MLRAVGRELERSPAQVMLRWQLQKGYITIPKAASRRHIEQNTALYDFELSPDQVRRLEELDEGASVLSWRPEPGWY